MPENTKTEDQKPKTESRIFWIVFAALTVVVYLTGLTIPLLGPDEPRYSQVAREMFERGDWVTPRLGGFDWFEKPALLYWLQIAAYKLFGVTEFAARFGSALFGLGTILSLWILGKKTEYGRQKAEEIQNPKSEIRNRDGFANWLMLIAASTLGLIVFARGASFDIILTFPVTAALVSFFVWEISRRAHSDLENTNNSSSKFPVSSAALFSFYFFIGVALIAKGLVGIVFPLAIVAFYYLLSLRFPPRAFIFSLFWGTIVSLTVAATWYLPVYRANGWKFVDEFFIQHHFQRYTSNKYFHPQPFYFFFWVLPLMTLPWLPFFFGSIWQFIRGIISRGGAKPQSEALSTQHSALSTFAVAWLLVPLVFFSASGSKLPGYILPALPAAIILTALFAWRFVQKSRARQIFVKAIAVTTLIVVALLAQFFVSDFLHEETVKHLVENADARGLKNERILGLHTVSHSAEFYAAGRLARDSEGKQKRFFGVAEVVEEMRKSGERQALVLIPVGYLTQLTNSPQIEMEFLGDNDDVALVLVKIR
jgi:4-amino-4-deoxy-L-arabinose transferase-like glycosyltransferase